MYYDNHNYYIETIGLNMIRLVCLKLMFNKILNTQRANGLKKARRNGEKSFVTVGNIKEIVGYTRRDCLLQFINING